ncbi:sensor histidine kinase [Halapricum sp. CBA1109]|uniref:cache domain-containing sensor histidine kinase n=1 Tax=Halapricum sp. CBA1109 TaxID=2668068 RepID=UPI0012FA7777|nr:ATP-binding protein [Halapricum sp. CBA1109]MUV90670.1 sensor histidine kinase [Halapricum sp. CBA1109]
MRLRTTLVALLLLIAVVLSGTIYFGFSLHKDDVVEQERQQVSTAASVVATDIDSSVEGKSDLVELWTRNEAVGAHGTPAQRTALSSFVDQSVFDGASVVHRNGTMVAIESPATTGRADVVGRNYSDRQYVRAARNGTTYVSDPVDADTGRTIVAISAPIRENGAVVGVLTGSLHLDRTTLFDGVAGLSRSSNRVVVTTNDTTLYTEPGTPSPEAALTETATVESTGWTVTVHGSRAQLTRRLQTATLLQFGAVLVALLSVAVVGVWVSRTTISQLDSLVEGLDDLERGSYGRTLDLSVTDEWRTISDRYNGLSDTLQRRESQLQVLNRVLRHNLRNDMNVVTAHAESILANEEASESVTENVEKIHATARRLIDTSEHARAFYEDLLSDGEREPEPTDVTAIIETRVETLRAEFPECTLQTDLPERAMALDTTVLPIVVEELIHNAIVHNDRPADERTVAVSARVDREGSLGDHGEVVVDVTDNGPGIPMVEEALLTDELEETPVEHGSGLGVWLVNWLVHRLGGTVEAHSGIERGTTVTVRVPAAPPEA